MGRFRNLPQKLFVEPRFDDVSLVVLNKINPAFRISDAEEFTIWAAHAYRENKHALLGRGFGSLNCAAVVVFTVRKEDKDFVVVVLFFEGAAGCFDGFGQGGAPLRNDVYVQGVHTLAKSFVVE